jgi:acetate kinase
MTDAVLSLNPGSSSLKFALFELGPQGPEPAARGQIEGIGSQPHLVVHDGQGQTLAERRWPGGAALPHEAFFSALFDWIEARPGAGALVAVGHRVVHGGTEFSGPVRVTPEILAKLEALVPLAPLHQPHSIAAIRAAEAVRPDLPQIAAFDTAFHRTLPPVAARLALTRELEAQGVRRYGFHGLSYEYIARRLAEVDPALARGRTIVAHLGAGASLCALQAGVSVDTTMSFTPVDGLVMGTRCGALDPGVILHLVQTLGWDAQAIEDLIYRRSGLLGISGLTGDMRTLLASPDPNAAEAVNTIPSRPPSELTSAPALRAME